MKIQLIAVGRMNDAPIVEATQRYIKRLKHYVPFEYIELPDVKNTRAMTEPQQKEAEGLVILNAVTNRDYVVLLDERGKEFCSREFAEYIDKRMANASGNIIFVVGGPYGFSDAVYQRADNKISLSRLTFSHEMVRLFFVEQLYRAMTILRGEPYHHD